MGEKNKNWKFEAKFGKGVTEEVALDTYIGV